MKGGRGGRFRPALRAAAALVLLTCAYTWPLAANLRSAVPHDRGDPLLVTWILWWSTKAVPLTERWWNAPAFYPSTGVLGFSETLLSLAPITAPIIAITSSPLAAYNVAFLLSFVLSGMGAYFLGFVLTARHDAALVAAVAFAFAPYRLSHTNHLQVLSSYWMPVALAALHIYARSSRPYAAVLFAAAWLLQSLTSGYYFFFLSLLIVLWLGWFGPWQLSRRQLAVVGACWITAAALMMPLLLGYRAVHTRYGLKRSPVEIEHYSADVAGLLSAPRDSWLWGRLRTVEEVESELFPGVTMSILVAGGVLTIGRRSVRRPMLAFYLGTALLMWLLALGPHPAFLGRPLGLSGPYAMLMRLPGFDEMRVPARLWMLSVLCLSIAAALIVARVPRGRTSQVLVAASLIGFLLDGWPRSFALAAAPELRPPPRTGAIARLGLPLANNETESMYRTIGDGLPVFNGYSGYDAPQHAPLRDLLGRREPAILDVLAADGPIQIVVEDELDPDRSWRSYVEHAGAQLLDSGTGWSRYQLAQHSPVGSVNASGVLLPIARATANVNPADVNAILDGDLDTRWHSAQQRGGESVTVDLGTARSVAWAVLCIGTYTSQYPRSLVVESSVDGTTWTLVWSGRTALAAYRAAIADPRAVPIAVPINRQARLLRLRQTADEPTRGWTIVELRILG